ncbi:4-hydroxyphenylacetate 3-hydroxylase C-terminal domain-containing protein [Nocardioides sp. NPDC058538]|uniref:4-hydroxyphenylacetate 3-hydroxylase C-terminal domain-containing protein n=1 Tax=Nocardioides sp. NPDC058538 TaxID=3346542 RepID=UPI0036469035
MLEKYYAAAIGGEERLRLANFVADLTARDYGGYQRVLATHAEGSFEAEKLQILRSFDASCAVA